MEDIFPFTPSFTNSEGIDPEYVGTLRGLFSGVDSSYIPDTTVANYEAGPIGQCTRYVCILLVLNHPDTKNNHNREKNMFTAQY